MILLLGSCNQVDYRPCWTYNGPCPADSEQYEEDKQQFVQSYLTKSHYIKIATINCPNTAIENRFLVIVDTILYSKDLRFLFIFYACGDRGSFDHVNAPLSKNPTRYECSAAIGYRDTIQNSLTFYDTRLTINWDNYRDGMDGLESYYLKDFKDERVIPTWAKYGKVGYNVNDSAFFEQSRLFRMFKDSLYYFQIEHVKDRSFKNMPDSAILMSHF